MLEPSNPPPKVSLEQLLRLKRHERPRPEYWERFDRELREKALRALVQPAPWHARWSHILVSRVAPWLALGATSVVIAGFAMHNNFLQPPASLLPATPAKIAQKTTVTPAAAPVLAATLPSSAKIAAPPPPMAPANPLPAARPTYAVTSLAETSNSSNYHTVHATVAFAAGRPEGGRYAPETVVTLTAPARETRVAY
jgi:hypothetical protein